MPDPAAAGAPGSASTTMPLPPPAGAPPAAGAPPGGAPPPPPTAPTFVIPKDYADRPYLKGIDTPEKLFAMLDGAQTLIGQRPAGIPKADAPADEWNKFYDAMGRPKTAAEYEFEIDPAIKQDEKVVGEMKEILHRHGLTPIQAKGLQKDFDAFATKIAKERNLQIQQQNTDFDKLGTKLFGADRDKVMALGKGLLDEFTPAELKPLVASLSNENLMILSGVLKGIHGKYIKADGAPPPPGGGPPGGVTPDALRAEARALMGTPAYKDGMNPDHDRVCKQVDELYRRAAGVQK